MHGKAAGTFGWHGGEGVISFDPGAVSEMVAAHEIGHALLNGDESDHVSCMTDVLNVMANPLLCWGPVAREDLGRVCAMHPEMDCSTDAR